MSYKETRHDIVDDYLNESHGEVTIMNELNMRNKLDATLENGMFAIVERNGRKHAIKVTGGNTQVCLSEVDNVLSPTGKNWAESSGLYTWALWNAAFIGYADSL